MNDEKNVGMQIDTFSLSMPDDEVLSLINKWKHLSEWYWKVLNEWETNMKYYDWSIVDEIFETATQYNSNDNRIYISVKTIIPMVTSKPAEPVVYAWKPWDDKSEDLANNHQKLLRAIYESKDVQWIVEKVVLHNLIYWIWIIFYWLKDWDIFTTYIHPEKLLIDMEATCIDDAQFIWIKNSDTAENLIAKFPAKERYIKDKVDWKLWTKLEYIEWFTDEYLIVSCDTIILSKKKNPHFDFNWKDVIDPETWERYTIYNENKNYFKQPKKPFLILNTENDWSSIIDTTSSVKQARPLQDNINRIKKMIAINVEKSWNPIRVSRWLAKKDIEAIDTQLTAWWSVWLTQEQELNYLQAAALPWFVYQDLEHSIKEIDNIFWTHSTTRWERDARETASWRQILRQWDEDVQAWRWRAIERMLNELYKAWTQLIKIHFTQEEIAYTLWDKWSKEYVKASANAIEQWMQIRVLAWSTIPDDKITKMNRALQLAQLWLFPRELLYKELWYENYREIAQSLDEQDAIAQMRQQEIMQQEQEMKQNEQVWWQVYNQLQQQIQELW